MDCKYFKEIVALAGVVSKKKVFSIMLLMILLSIFELASIGIILPYIDIAADNGENLKKINDLINGVTDRITKSEALIYGGIILILLFVVKSFFSVLIKKNIISFCHDVLAELRYRLTSTYLNQSYIDYSSRNSSEYIHSIQTMSNHYAGSVLRPTLMLFSELFVAIIMLIYAAIQFPFEFLVLIIFCVLPFLIYSKLTSKKVKKHGEEANKYQMKVISFLNQSILGYKEINVLNKNRFFQNELKENANKFAYHDTIPRVYGVMPRYLIETVLVMFIVFNVFFILFTEGDLNNLIPVLIIFAIISIKLIPVFALLMSTINEYRFLRNSVSLLYQDYKNFDSITVSESNRNEDNDIFKNLELKNVNFTYPKSKISTLNNINLKIDSNSITGIIGPSGSGKSTLANILLGFLKPTSGDILINNKKEKSVSKYMKIHAHYIPQNISINDTSIKENIAYGVKKDEIDEDEIKKSLDSAKLDNFVKDLPHGIDTNVGENGENISGGQRQRIGLARAFYHNRNILVLDESTSALDKNTENKIISEVNSMKPFKTIIMITHNPKILSICDHIYNIENGALSKV